MKDKGKTEEHFADGVAELQWQPGEDQDKLGRLKEALCRSEEERARLAAVIEQMAEAVAVTDADGGICYVNPAFECILGYPGREVRGRFIGMLLGESDDARWKTMWSEANRNEAFSDRIAVKKKGITERMIDFTASPIRDLSGQVTHHVVVVRDVTHEFEMERQLRHAQKMEALGTLAGGIAHDFNNILGVIMGCTQMVLMDLVPDAQAHRHLMQVLKAAHRAADLVKHILTFSRESEQERKHIFPGPIIKETLKMLRASLPSTIDIRQRIESDSGVVLADPAQIHQILVNLCTNAAHAMREKGGILEVIQERVEILSGDTFGCADMSAGAYVRLTVKDTGHGMTLSVMERIFDPYFTTKRAKGGSGLGLAVIHGIVKSLGGIIRVSSEPAKGSTFHVLLPLIDFPKKSAESETFAPIPRGNEQVLFIDDEEILVQVGQDILERLGYKVTAVTNSLYALEVFRTHPELFDLVIMDQTMPHMTGSELAGEMLSICSDIPIILCTGFSETITEEQAKALGIREFVMKPLAMRHLATTVRRLLDERSTKKNA